MSSLKTEKTCFNYEKITRCKAYNFEGQYADKPKTYEKYHRWNCGVEIKQNKWGTYTRLQA